MSIPDRGEHDTSTTKKKSRRKRRMHRVALVFGFTVVLGVLGVTAAFAIGYMLTPMPDPNKLVSSNTTIIHYDDGEEVLGTFAAQNRISVSLDQIPQHVQDAVLAAENRTFWDDPGISLTGMARAGWSTLTGDEVQGGSTITQQYVKNYYLTHEQTISRKLNELFITVKVERQLSKAEILQDYLNTIYFGRGAYGIETAAQEYFDKSVHELTPQEGAVLAAVARSPSNYDPADEDNRKRLTGRFNHVMGGLAEMEGSSVSGQDAAEAEVPEVSNPGGDGAHAGAKGYLLQEVRKELSGLGFSDQQIDAGGLRVDTTFNEDAQEAAENAVEENFPEGDTRGVRAGLAAVRPGTGELVAMYGGPDYLERNFNDATQARIEPGSTFKPFALAAALQSGVTLEDEFAGNSGFELDEGHTVNNEGDGNFGEYVDLLSATEDSVNTAYVDLTVNEVGAENVVDAATSAGIPEESPGLSAGPLVALGNASVAPVDMANSYATFASGGSRSSWHVVDKVTSRNGEVLYSADTDSTRQFDQEVTSNVTHALQQVVEDGTGEAAGEAGRPAAGKTGNHEGQTAWFSGYTPQLSTAVAFHRADQEGNRESLDGVGGMDSFTGSGYPAQIWAAFMREALEGEPVEQFPEPAEINQIGSSPSPAQPAQPAPTAEPEPEPEPEPTPTQTAEPEPEPTQTPEPEPTQTVEPEPTPTETGEPEPEPTETDTVEPETEPTAQTPTIPPPRRTDDPD